MKIFIAVTSYESKITTGCCESLLNNVKELESKGHEVKIYFHNGDCYIERARNYCVKLFLDSWFDNLMFVDCDLSFPADSMLKLFEHDKPIIAGVYPYRTDAIQELNDWPYPVTLKFDEDTGNCLDPETGLVSVLRAPTGFMRIKKEVFKIMMLSGSVRLDDKGLYNFFNTGFLSDNDNTWYGEDVSFLKKWRDLNGGIWVVPDIDFQHIGNKGFKGNLHKFLLQG